MPNVYDRRHFESRENKGRLKLGCPTLVLSALPYFNARVEKNVALGNQRLVENAGDVGKFKRRRAKYDIRRND